MKSYFCTTFIFCILVLANLLTPSLYAAVDSEENPRLPLAMEVFLKKPEQHQYELHIHLTNISEDPVNVDVRDLPWNPTDGPTWLSAYRMDAQQTLVKQDVPLGRFGSRMVRLLPGESIEDRIALNPRFPSLLDEIDNYGVQLKWACPPDSLKFVCKEGSSNTITIPKGDPGQPDIYTVDRQACLGMEKQIGLINIPQDHEVLFLLTPESVMTDLEKMISLLLKVDDYVRKCHPRWTNSWAVSFFTDEKFAGFLSEGENRRYFEEGLWQQANIGNYSSQIRTLFRFPWIKKRSDTVYLSLHPLRQQSTT